MSGDAGQADVRRALIERVTASRFLNRSARLCSLLHYLAERVLEGAADEIHEQEVGHRVFGRAADYDTTSDNIVRVHASTLRKRLEQYFASDGADEQIIIEIPKGNYAPVFRKREADEAPLALVEDIAVERPSDWRLWVLASAAAIFACSTAYFVIRDAAVPTATFAPAPTSGQLWARVFQPRRQTDVVLDDAAVGLYQELTGRPLNLSTYYDRSYLRNLPDAAQDAHLDPQSAEALVLRRQSSYAGASILWKLLQMPGGGQRVTQLRFARDYSFREMKANNAVLLGNSRSNPWIEPFEPHLGLRWTFDKATGNYFPVDTWAAGRKYQSAAPGDPHEGYCAIALLPNLGRTGSVLIITGTGGSAVNAGADFLADEASVAHLRRLLPAQADGSFPDFEALIKVKGRSATPRDAEIVLCRQPAR